MFGVKNKPITASVGAAPKAQKEQNISKRQGIFYEKTLNPIVPKNSKWRFGEMTFASKKISENNTQSNFNLNM